MSDKEKQLLETISRAIPAMDERAKGYFLGYADALLDKKKEEENAEDRK